MKKKVISSIVSIVLMLVYIIAPSTKSWARTDGQAVKEYQTFIQNELAVDSEKYIKKELDTIRTLITSCKEELDITVDATTRLELGKPFVIYTLDREEQEESVYYPLVDEEKEKIRAVITVVNTTEGWQYTISEDWAEKLNDADYLNKDYLFYQKEGNITAQSGDRKVILNGDAVKDVFDDKSISVKEKTIKKKIKKWRKLDIKRSKKSGKGIGYGYSPSMSQHSGGYYCFNLYKAQGQGRYMTCWAAAVATTINYRRGTNYTTKQIVDCYGLTASWGYNINVINRAINEHGLNYKYIETVPSSKILINSVKKKWPVVIGGHTDGKPDTKIRGHAVTVIGYRILDGKKYYMLWDSALNDGKGGTSTVLQRKSGVVFASGGFNFSTDAASYYRTIAYK